MEVAALPMLSLGGGQEGDAWLFAIPLIALGMAFAWAVRAARRTPGEGALWLVFALMALLAAASAAAALVTGLTGTSIPHAPYFGSAASLLMVVATVLLARRTLRELRLDALIEALIFVVLGGALSVYFVVLPGLESGDAFLTVVFAVDLAALALATVSALAGSRGDAVAWSVAGGVAAATVGDGLLSAGSSGQALALTEATALTWAMAGSAFAWAANAAIKPPQPEPQADRWVLSRILLPFAAVVALPEVALVLEATEGLSAFAAVFFASMFLLILLLVFLRQGYLLRDNRRAIDRERRLGDAMANRNKDLQALTGLVATMTQSLEEAPLIERGLEMLAFGARAASAALHVPGAEGPELLGRSGAWDVASEWAEPSSLPTDGADVREERGSLVIRLPLRARGSFVGAVTLVRPVSDALDDDELGRLKVLANQLSIAIQNARDYREKLQQTMRDPLTGVYNRRYFYEAMRKEVLRAERYGSPVSVVLFDIDDFKQINDTLGHAKGDDALRRVTEIAESQIRNVDSFARIGGEEFALLLPETKRLDGLLVADRVRAAVARSAVLEDRRVTLSGGVACCPHDGVTSEEVEKQADAALYWAKRNGKNICAVASEVTATGEDHAAAEMPAHLSALVSTIDSQPMHTREHSENVASYAVAIGQELGLDEDRIVCLRRAAFLHDIGKIAVPRETLAKPDGLSAAEWEEIRIHPGVGLSILSHAGFSEEAGWVGQHHERVDGKGYPRGLQGEEIALEARIILVADAFEAMTSDRPYRAGMPVDKAIEELLRCAGKQFDERVVAAMAELLGREEVAVLALRG